MPAKTVTNIVVSGKTVVVRVDFNVPFRDGRITSDRRIVQALPTLRLLLDKGAKLVLMSHFERPSGKGFEPQFSMAPIAERLSAHLGLPVRLGPPEVAGPAATAMAATLKPGEVMLLENLRFRDAETIIDKAKKNPDGKLRPDQQEAETRFVTELASLGDVYVNDAFGTCHRKHASMYGLPLAIKKKGGDAVAGLLVAKEIQYLHDALSEPKRPFVAIQGGAKVADKLKVVRNLLGKVDRLLIGGAMAYTMLKAAGHRIGRSLLEADQVEDLKALLGQAGEKVLLPVDHVATEDFDAGPPIVVPEADLPDGLLGMDIGPETIRKFSDVIASAGTILWNGPVGVFERPEYLAGTRAIAEALVAATARGAVTVIGGGDTTAAVESMGLSDGVTHVSTGGGASMEYLEGRSMPSIDVLG